MVTLVKERTCLRTSNGVHEPYRWDPNDVAFVSVHCWTATDIALLEASEYAFVDENESARTDV